MATLTPTQLTYLRDLTGGRTTTGDDDHLTDPELQAMYDEAVSVWDTAVVYVLRRRLGMASKMFAISRDLNSESRNQYRDFLADLLAKAEVRAGLQGGSLSVGTLDYNLDTDADD